MIGQSHQILHVYVIVGIHLHFYDLCYLFHSITRTEKCIMSIKLKFAIIDLPVSSSI